MYNTELSQYNDGYIEIIQIGIEILKYLLNI